MTFPCKAATVWSDDFNDGNYNGWYVTNGTFSAEDHTLRSIGAGGCIIHPSSVTTGTWSFDILGVNDTTIGFIGNYPVPISGIKNLCIYKSSGFALDLIVAPQGYSSGYIDTEYDFPSSTKSTGWQHIDATRSSDGRICVYINGTLVIDKVNTQFTTTSDLDYFCVWLGVDPTAGFPSPLPFFGSEGAIDNIVVSNTVDIQPPAAPFYMQTWFLTTVGAVIVVVVVAAVFLIRRKK
jgi:hypothetical protein